MPKNILGGRGVPATEHTQKALQHQDTKSQRETRGRGTSSLGTGPIPILPKVRASLVFFWCFGAFVLKQVDEFGT